MSRGIEIEPIESPGDDARVCHYDQLGEGVKGRFPQIVPEDGTRSFVETESDDAFGGCDVVKYTRYYRVVSSSTRPE